MLLNAAHRGQLQHWMDQGAPSRKRPREDEGQARASYPPIHTKTDSHSVRVGDMTDLSGEQQARSGTEAALGSKSDLLADGRASRRAPGFVQKAPHPHATALAGNNTKGRASSGAPGVGTGAGAGASSRAPWPPRKGFAQPAFIRVGDDKPRTAHGQAPSSSASGYLHGIQSCSTAAQTDAFTPRPVPSTHQRLTVPAPAASCSAAALLTTHSSTSPHTRTVGTVPASQAAALAVGCTDSPRQSSDTPRLNTPALVPSAVLQAQVADPIAGTMSHAHESAKTAAAATTAAAGTPVHDATAQVAITIAGTLSNIDESAGAAAIAASPVCITTADATAEQQHGGHEAAAAETLASGVVMTPPVLTPAAEGDGTSGASASVQPRAVLPSSRRKRKGPKAAKPLEPVKAEHSWQGLLGPDDCGKSEAPARALPTGMTKCLAMQRKGSTWHYQCLPCVECAQVDLPLHLGLALLCWVDSKGTQAAAGHCQA